MNLGSFWNCPNQFKKGLRSFHVSVERKERKKKKEKSSESSLSRLRHGCRKTLRTILQIPRSEFAFCIAPFLHPHHRHSAIYFVSLSNRPHRRTSTQTLSNSLDKRLRFTVNTYIYIYTKGGKETRDLVSRSFSNVQPRHGCSSREAKHAHETIFHGHSIQR